jgi:3-hydroxybutyryl-CoA dehydrogenase
VSRVRVVGVAGAGLMGAGIAQAAATAGFTTLLQDVDTGALVRARASIEKSTAKLVEKGKLDASARSEGLARLSTSTDLGTFATADLVIEAITEDPAAKATLFQGLHSLCPAATIFASNTSSLSIAALGSASGRADRFVGLHFFNPVPLMPLVEVVRGIATSDESHAAALEVVQRMGKEAVEARDVPGFVVNLLLVPYLLDAARAVERRVASTIDIDRGMSLGAGHPMGPLSLLDFVGLDTVVRIGDIMFEEYREQRYAPPPLLRRMVASGWLGRKSGRGFYDYSGAAPVPVDLA